MPTTTGVRALKIRHNNVLGYFVEVTAQHGDKLLSAAAQRHLHPSPDARRPGALHHHRARRTRSQDRQRRRPRARRSSSRSSTSLAAIVTAASRRHQGLRPSALAILDVATALGATWRSSATTCGRRSTARSISSSRWPPSGAWSRLARRRRTVRRQRLRPLAAHAATTHGRIYLLTGPNMAGKSTFLRQNALIAILAADGQLRAGAPRQDRRRRPAVLARRRSRRSRARALDLHGRDGGDRGHPQSGRASARSSSSTRSAAAPPPSTGSRSPGRRSSICTRRIAAAHCSPPISTS